MVASGSRIRAVVKIIVPLFGVIFVAMIWMGFPRQKITTPAALAPVRARPTPPQSLEVAETVEHPILASSAQFQSVSGTAEDDLEIVTAVLDSFRRAFDGNPVGENEEIFVALRGKNPKKIRYLPDQFPGLQDDGRVVDRWGTPWRFHALSGREMEVLCAGPDCLFGTQDDIGHQESP